MYLNGNFICALQSLALKTDHGTVLIGARVEGDVACLRAFEAGCRAAL
jgi:hypothetical protein